MKPLYDYEWIDITEHIWFYLKKYEVDEEWNIESDMIKGLKQLGLGHIADENIGIETAKSRNIHLRDSVSKYLTNKNEMPITIAGNHLSKIQIFDWIVYNWGKIPEGSRESSKDKFNSWDKELNYYTYSDLRKFCSPDRTNFMESVSSWSKIISFIDCLNFPIYDSRVAVALNILLSDLHEGCRQFRFFMPQGASESTLTCMWTIQEDWQNKANDEANRINGKRRKGTEYGRYRKYDFYLTFLDWLIKLKDIKDKHRRESINQNVLMDRLDCEMKIFGASKKIIDDYYASIINGGLSEKVSKQLENYRTNQQNYKDRKINQK